MKKNILMIGLLAGLWACDNNTSQEESTPQDTLKTETTDSLSTIQEKQDNTTTLNILTENVGKYPYELALFEQADFINRAKALLGDKYSLLEERLEVQTPLEKKDNLIFFTGIKKHDGGINEAMVAYDSQRNLVYVGLCIEGKKQIYTEQITREQYPQPVTIWQEQ